MTAYKILGLMSGTSLDGLDLALCTFQQEGNTWVYAIERIDTIPYTEKMLNRLKQAPYLSGFDLSLLDNELGALYGDVINAFLAKDKVDLIASHGHTIFHQPHLQFTKQIGSGAAIFAKTGIATACDFRSVDVFLGGQGAPLVPLGDKHLFSEYDYRINLGGIANISFEEQGSTKAFDVCPVNQVFNVVAEKLGKAYDDNGDFARTGQLNEGLLKQFNELDFYKQSGPKSLGREWVEEYFLSQVEQYVLADFQHTFAHHVVDQLAKSMIKQGAKALLTGGGAYNVFLVELLQAKRPDIVFVVPNKALISFKEALIFAFLGLLGARGENTALASVTGASKDALSMALYGKFVK